jgi:S-(hydroxymethyl)glutathione dehydrogenase/alcohol dehydrogenase
VAPGDRVIPYLLPHCGICPYCRSGRTNYCVEFLRSFRRPEDTPFTLNGERVASYCGTGTFSEFTVTREDQVVKVNGAAPASPTCCIGCGVATGLGAVLKTANVRKGASVVIFGAGGVGLSASQGASIAGAGTIILVDINADKEAVARRMGATHFINAATGDVVEQVMQITVTGADYCFECVGSVELTRQAFACANCGWGEVVSVGMIPDSTPPIIAPTALRNRTWRRSLMGSATLADVADYVDWYVEGRLNLDDIVSHVVPLEQINAGIDLMHHGKAARVTIDYSA